jgi:extracellular elastinolytic metalloproteinase
VTSLPACRLRVPAATLLSLLGACVLAGGAAGTPSSEASESLQSSLGDQGVVDLDPLTGTPRVVARLDGFLTGAADGDPVDLVFDYVRANEELFGLDEDDFGGLRLVRNETDPFGVRHLLWVQEAAGIPAYDNDLRASVTSDGRIVNVLGSPLPDFEPPPGAAPSAASISGGEAVAAALRATGHPPAGRPRPLAAPRGRARATRFAGGHSGSLVLVNTGRGVRLAWRVSADADSDEVFTSLVDASTGDVLRSDNKVDQVSGLAWDYYPGAPSGGTQISRDFTTLGWLSANAETLNGTNARVFSDWNDNDAPDASGGGGVGGNEETDPTLTGLQVFDDYTHAAGLCAPTHLSICSWDSTDNGPFPQPPGWYGNRRQNAVEVFYFVNRFHDHLEDDPDIAWTTRSFEGPDKVEAHAGDGADTGVSGEFLGLHMPDISHINNANMYTPPDGQSPRMQMYLFTSLTGNFNTDPTPDVNGGDDAAVVYHEYTHGLSSRLITYADGWSALDSFQSGAMGEGWSDWYALDFLVEEGFAPNAAAAGDVKLDRYVGNNRPTLRTEGLDCLVAPATSACPGGHATGSHGGYTYGDMGRISPSGPAVHADGEIWSQTLWALRQAVGVGNARFLVTEAMRLSPRNPSFLDMRNAILQANQVGVLDGRSDQEATIWQVFASRGMGFFASTAGADDTTPIESFSLPPDPGDGVGSLTGVVKDADTGEPAAGVEVAVAGLDFSDTTDAAGQYLITDVPVGTYPLVIASKGGVRPRGGFERRRRRRHRERARPRRAARLGRVRRRWKHSRVRGAELHLVRLRAGARDRPVPGRWVVDDQAGPRADRSTLDHREAADLRRCQRVRGRPWRGLRRSRQRFRERVQNRDFGVRLERLVDVRANWVVHSRSGARAELGAELPPQGCPLRPLYRHLEPRARAVHGRRRARCLWDSRTNLPGQAGDKGGHGRRRLDQRRLGGGRDRELRWK